MRDTKLNSLVDEVAERARTLAGNALGTMAELLHHTRFKEHMSHYPDAQAMIALLLVDHENIRHHLRVDLETCAEPYHNMGTDDFLTGLLEQHEKMTLMLGAFFEGK